MAGNDLVSMQDQFKGLPMADLIGGPLTAVCEANKNLALAAADYIDKVGMDAQPDGSRKARMVTFSATKPNIDESGNVTQQTVTFQAPMLALVEVPNLFVRKAVIDFNMEVRSSFTQTTEKSASGSMQAQASYGWGLFKASVNIQGSVSSKDAQTRQSDNSAKYAVHIEAEDRGLPEGMAKVLDIMRSLITPTSVTTSSGPTTGGTGTGSTGSTGSTPAKT